MDVDQNFWMNGPKVEEQLSGGRHLLQVFEPTLPPKSRSQLQHRHLISSSNGGRTAKLTVTTAKGKLKVILEESFTQHSNVLANTKSPKRASPTHSAFLNLFDPTRLVSNHHLLAYHSYPPSSATFIFWLTPRPPSHGWHDTWYVAWYVNALHLKCFIHPASIQREAQTKSDFEKLLGTRVRGFYELSFNDHLSVFQVFQFTSLYTHFIRYHGL